MLTRIRSWLRPKRTPAEWVYDSHEYSGLIDGNHVYLVIGHVGGALHTKIARLHGGVSKKDDDRLAVYFAKWGRDQ